MPSLFVPPPARVAVGFVMVGGQRAEVFLNPEWARYFDALNTQVVVVRGAVGLPGAPGATGAAGAAVSLGGGGDADNSVEFIPGPKGETGPQGAPGPAVGLLANDCETVEFMPGVKGDTGPQGPAGPALFMLQEPENNDVFWPIRNS